MQRKWVKATLAVVCLVALSNLAVLAIGGITHWSAVERLEDGRRVLSVQLKDQIVYRVVLDPSDSTSIIELHPRNVSAPGWKETFRDETVLPGRWTISRQGLEIDIMPAAMIINGNRYLPGSTATLSASGTEAKNK